jgi:hypothetical protein
MHSNPENLMSAISARLPQSSLPCVSRRIGLMSTVNPISITVLFSLLLQSICCHCVVAADTPRLMVFQAGSQSWTGRVLARSDDNTWIMDQFGELVRLEAREITHLEVAAPAFRPASIDAFLQRLRSELPRGYQVVATKHFVIAAPRSKLDAYREIFEGVFTEVSGFLAARELPADAPALPLVALVFADHDHFRDYCHRDNTRWSPDLRGYYSLKTNRVVVVDAVSESPETGAPSTQERFTLPQSAKLLGATLSARTVDTIIHETTHQIGFNVGVHSRFGKSPQWLVEGLAMHLESNRVRTRAHGRNLKPSEQINPERLEWFRREYSNRRTLGDVAAIVASDELFNRHSFDAYSLSWALTCYLSTGRSREENAEFSAYVQKTASKGPFENYSTTERLKDFHDAFGDPATIEQGLLRFLEEMASN